MEAQDQDTPVPAPQTDILLVGSVLLSGISLLLFLRIALVEVPVYVKLYDSMAVPVPLPTRWLLELSQSHLALGIFSLTLLAALSFSIYSQRRKLTFLFALITGLAAPLAYLLLILPA